MPIHKVLSTDEFSIFGTYESSVIEQVLLPITFSSWSESGEGQIFGGGLMVKENLASVLITSRSNNWWHSKQLIAELEAIIANSNMTPLLYGSSMGGYGALHFGLMFDTPVLALSPQAMVIPQNVPNERRWSQDRNRIVPVFDEVFNLGREHKSQIICFFDFSHTGDNLHRKLIAEHMKDEVAVDFVNVPYSHHTPIRALTGAGILQSILPGLCLGGQLSLERLREMSSEAYKRWPKGLADFLRSDHPDPKSKDYLDLLYFCETEKDGDFEYHYMMAEAWARYGDKQRALSHAERATQLHKADYVLLKQATIMHSFGGTEEARAMILALRADPVWSPVLEAAVTTGVLRHGRNGGM